jgi:putative hydrolase of the HAD superfamily
MSKVRAIVFDVGGTLICPAKPVGETYAAFARRQGVKLKAEATTAAFAAAFKGCSPRAKDAVPCDGDDRAWWKLVVRRSVPEAAFTDPKAFDEFFEAVYLHYAKPEAWDLYPEVIEILEELRDFPVDLAVLSNWDARLHPVLDGHGIGEQLTRRFISSELGWEKPDPAIYRHVSDVLRLPPESLLSVGDHGRNDIEGPRKAGWQTLQIERPKRDLWAVVAALKRR